MSSFSPRKLTSGAGFTLLEFLLSFLLVSCALLPFIVFAHKAIALAVEQRDRAELGQKASLLQSVIAANTARSSVRYAVPGAVVWQTGCGAECKKFLPDAAEGHRPASGSSAVTFFQLDPGWSFRAVKHHASNTYVLCASNDKQRLPVKFKEEKALWIGAAYPAAAAFYRGKVSTSSRKEPRCAAKKTALGNLAFETAVPGGDNHGEAPSYTEPVVFFPVARRLTFYLAKDGTLRQYSPADDQSQPLLYDVEKFQAALERDGDYLLIRIQAAFRVRRSRHEMQFLVQLRHETGAGLFSSF